MRIAPSAEKDGMLLLLTRESKHGMSVRGAMQERGKNEVVKSDGKRSTRKGH